MLDKDVKALVEQELAWEASLDPADIGVTVESGVVRLVGHVAAYPQKLAAQAAAERVRGVRGLVDELEIRPFPHAYSDEAIAARVANALDGNVQVDRQAVRFRVEKGLVTLSGEVDWAFQRAAAERGVREIKGVRGLANHIVLKTRPTETDLQEAVQTALARQSGIDAGEIHVTLEGDVVRLEGQVAGRHEHAIACGVVWNAPGVRRLDDRLRIGPTRGEAEPPE